MQQQKVVECALPSIELYHEGKLRKLCSSGIAISAKFDGCKAPVTPQQLAAHIKSVFEDDKENCFRKSLKYLANTVHWKLALGYENLACVTICVAEKDDWHVIDWDRSKQN